MPELGFRVLGARPLPFSALPCLELALGLACKPESAVIESLLLRCTVRIDALARRHTATERARLAELFGAESAWGQTSQNLVWARESVVVPGFVGTTEFTLSLPCSYDLSCAASKYLRAVTREAVPITLQFAGTLFQRGPSGLQVTQIPWDREAAFALPAQLFGELMRLHFPERVPVALTRECLDRLERARALRQDATVEQTLHALLDAAEAGEPT